MSKKHYMTGSTDVSAEDKKIAGEAVEQQQQRLKEQLERQAEASKVNITPDQLKPFPYKPHQDRVVVLPRSNDQITASGIIIPDTAGDKPSFGIVIALGEELSQNQKIIFLLETIASKLNIEVPYPTEIDQMEVSIGDTVLFGQFAGAEIEVDGVKYRVIRYADIWAHV